VHYTVRPVESCSTSDIDGAFQRSCVWILATPSWTQYSVRKDLVSPAGIEPASQRIPHNSECRAYSRERLHQLQLLYLVPDLEKRVVSFFQQKERHQKDTRKTSLNPAPETLCWTTAFNRPIRIIVDPDDLIPWMTVRIRENPDHLSCLGFSSSLFKANNTAKSSDFSHSCTFFCYLLAFCSSVPPSFFPKRHHLQVKTTKPSQLFSSSTFTNNITQYASQGFRKSSFPSFQSTLCLPLHLPLNLRLGSTRARESGTQDLFGSARA
jgi:hypothetical protein